MSYRELSGARPSRELKKAPSFSATARADILILGESAPPSSLTLAFADPPPDQLSIPCCVAITITTAMRFVRGTATLSPLFNYYLSRTNPAVIDDVEMFNALSTAAVDGICLLPLHPSVFDTASALTAPTPTAITDAATRQLGFTPTGQPGFASVAVDVVEWKTALNQSLPVLVGFFMSPEYDAIRGGISRTLTKPTARGNGHAVLAIGYDDVAQHFLIRDSRGASVSIWHMPYDRLGDSFVFESWVIM